jgi:hypothetical protein
MTDTDRIAQMAREAGIDIHADTLCRHEGWAGPMREFARLVAEDCAKLAQSTVCDTHLPTGVRIYGTHAAQAIRARYSKEG